MSQELIAKLDGFLSETQKVAADFKAGLKTLDEVKATQELLKADIAAINDLRRAEKERLPSDAPLDGATKQAASMRGGFRKLPLKKALALPSTHAILRSGDRDALQELHDYHDACAIAYFQMKRKSDSTQAWARLQHHEDFVALKALLQEHGYLKANEIMHPDSGGVGNLLDFTLLSSTMIDKMRLELTVADKFRQITQTRSSQKFPTRTGDGFGVLGGSSATSPPAKDAITTGIPSAAHFTAPAFGERQFDVKHLLVFMWWNDDMLEDSIVPWLPMMREDLSFFAARTMDRAILDGDASATHMDTDAHAVGAIDFRKAWYGLRKMSKNNWVNGGGGTLDETDLHAARKSLGMYGKSPSKLVYFISLQQYYDLVALGVVKTVDLAGERAALFNGVLGSLWGIPLVVSEFVREDVDINGVNAASGNTLSTLGVVNTERFVRTQYAGVSIEETRIAPMLTTILQYDLRCDFGPWDATALTSGMWAASTADIPCNFVRNLA